MKKKRQRDPLLQVAEDRVPCVDGLFNRCHAVRHAPDLMLAQNLSAALSQHRPPRSADNHVIPRSADNH
eukprot:937278-Rhodomonas_salina.2